MQSDPSKSLPNVEPPEGGGSRLRSDQFLEGLAAVATGVVRTAAVEVDTASRFPAEGIHALRASGAMGALIPRDLGGLGLGLSAVTSGCTLLGAECASTAMIFAMHHIQVACIVRHGEREQFFQELLIRIAGEGLLLASATSEVGTGGDLMASTCFVEQDDNALALRKSCPVISYGADADGFLVTARASERAQPSDQVLVYLDADEVQLQRTATWDAMGMRGTVSDGYDMVATGDSCQILPEHFREIASRTMVPVSHLMWASVWLGIAIGALDRSRSLVRSLPTRGSLANDLKREQLVKASARVQSLRAALEYGVHRFEGVDVNASSPTPLAWPVELNNLKLEVSTGALEVALAALSVCGVEGYRNNSPHSVGRYVRDAASASLMIHNDRLTEANIRLLGATRKT